MRISLAAIRAISAYRPDGYEQDVLSRGIVKGAFLNLDAAAYAELCAKYRFGDKLARIAQPIAGAIDAAFGTKVKNCGGCRKMQERLNAGESIGSAIKKRIRGQ